MAAENGTHMDMSPAAAASETVELTIRCGMQSYDDVVVTCPINWSVKQLKEHLKEVYPSQPEVGRQRLIFYGRCLEDDRTVTSYFPTREIGAGDCESPQSQVIHLVCPPRSTNELEEGLRRRNVNNASNNNTHTSNSQTPQAAPTVVTGQPFHYNYMGMQGMYGYVPNVAVATPNHYANSYAQAYAAYMQQYYHNMMLMHAQANGTPMPMQNFPVLTFNNGMPQGHARAFVVHHQVHQQHLVDPAQAQPAGAAQAAANNDDVQQPRDFLAVAYKAFQIGLLLMLVLTNSSAERFFAVFAAILLFWFLQNRRDRAHQEPRPIPPPQAQPNGEEIHNGANLGNEGTNAGQIIVDDVPSAWTVFWSTCYTFISSFFLSLLPDNHIPVNAN